MKKTIISLASFAILALPAISLAGPSPFYVHTVGSPTMSLPVGANYIEQGAVAIDLRSGANLPVVETGSVNTAVAGTYILKYTATLIPIGITVSVFRTVTVK